MKHTSAFPSFVSFLRLLSVYLTSHSHILLARYPRFQSAWRGVTWSVIVLSITMDKEPQKFTKGKNSGIIIIISMSAGSQVGYGPDALTAGLDFMCLFSATKWPVCKENWCWDADKPWPPLNVLLDFFHLPKVPFNLWRKIFSVVITWSISKVLCWA